MKDDLIKKIYVYILLLVMAIPFLLFFVVPSTTTTENKKLSEFPVVVNSEGKINVNYMKELSAYFEDRFAFRTNLVDINSKFRAGIFKTTPEDDVIVGENGWLYYSATLDDYRGDDLSSDRELYAMAKNIRLMQNYVENKDARFVFTIAPNKNTLYPENMPNQYKYVITKDHDAYRLEKYLDKLNVNYVNLFNEFANQDEILYLKTDSHWNKKGAVLSYNAMLDKAGKPHVDYSNISPKLDGGSMVGDLSSMIYPVNNKAEDDFKYDRDYSYKLKYCSNNTFEPTETDVKGNINAESEDVTLNEIITTSENGDGSLLMFRDSFGNSLIDLMAEEFEVSYFSKQEPYNLNKMEAFNSDVVILEKVERHIKSLSKVAPLMQADDINIEQPFLQEAIDSKPEATAKIDTTKENGLLKISGYVSSDDVSVETDIIVLVTDGDVINAYDAFLINENEFCVYLDTDNEDVSVKAIVIDGNNVKIVCDENKLQEVDADFESAAEKIRAEKEAIEKAEREAEKKALEEKKAEEERLAREEKEKAEQAEKERIQQEEKEKAENEKKSTGGKTIVSKVFYEDCGSDSGYYEIVWSDGSVTYEDVY